MGGAREAADIINNAGKAAEKRIMPEINRIDKALAREIENEMFKFEHLLALDPQAMGSLLREVESDTLIDALKNLSLIGALFIIAGYGRGPRRDDGKPGSRPARKPAADAGAAAPAAKRVRAKKADAPAAPADKAGE
jgi:hypothetical protein